jgi:hypothetical protein
MQANKPSMHKATNIIATIAMKISILAIAKLLFFSLHNRNNNKIKVSLRRQLKILPPKRAA